MPKFATRAAHRPRSPVRTTGEATTTYEGAPAHARDAKGELFVLAATNMVGEDTFYESAGDRDSRFAALVRQVAAEDPEFISGSADPARYAAGKVGLAEYLRSALLMRSAPVVMACEYAAAGGPNAARVVDRVCQRPDEPAELLGYWLSHMGRLGRGTVQRGLARAAARLYTEQAALRWDSDRAAIRMADVIQLAHPKPADANQDALFAWLLDERRHGDSDNRLRALEATDLLVRLRARWFIDCVPEADRGAFAAANPHVLRRAALSWEQLTAWLPGTMDAAKWELAIPLMRPMALVRNLRNFDQAGISEGAVDRVIAEITDPEKVAAARLFPYQVWAAYREAPSDNWKRALGKTLDLTTGNVNPPEGNLVVIDTSGSMNGAVSGRSKMSRVEVAAVMAMVVAKRDPRSDVVIFGKGSARVQMDGPGGLRSYSVLAGVQEIVGQVGAVGHATYGHSAIANSWDPGRHRRVVLFTDDQMADPATLSAHVPTIWTVNLAGYRPSSTPAGSDGRHTIGGFSDATFTTMAMVERGRSADWPFA